MAAAVIIIPILVVSIVAISTYLVYQLFLKNFLAKRSISQTLEKYNIQKTPFQIIKEYHENKGENLTHEEIQKLEKTKKNIFDINIIFFYLNPNTIYLIFFQF